MNAKFVTFTERHVHGVSTDSNGNKHWVVLEKPQQSVTEKINVYIQENGLTALNFFQHVDRYTDSTGGFITTDTTVTVLVQEIEVWMQQQAKIVQLALSPLVQSLDSIVSTLNNYSNFEPSTPNVQQSTLNLNKTSISPNTFPNIPPSVETHLS